MLQDVELRATVDPELYAEERLLWAGKPTPIYILRQYGEAVMTTIFIIFMVGIYVFGCYFFGVRSFSIDRVSVPIFSVLLIPIVVLALYITHLYRQAARTAYAVTNQRALIIKPTIDGKSVLAYNIIPSIERRSRASGRDDLIFASETYSPFLNSNFRGNSTGNYHYRIRKVGFFGIENALEVEQLLIKTFQPKRTGSSS